VIEFLLFAVFIASAYFILDALIEAYPDVAYWGIYR
jgi:hypothetical protein